MGHDLFIADTQTFTVWVGAGGGGGSYYMSEYIFYIIFSLFLPKVPAVIIIMASNAPAMLISYGIAVEFSKAWNVCTGGVIFPKSD